ncbi:hypothetical protein OP867_08390 [Limosilactobacillus fermentum]|nr:hypothetical protein [Limosilactobacillus fermentum]UVZ01817.1 hypothetical protein C0965_008025 [Limosilactobacillus fermentum]UZM84879.1 hypothetical protein OP867_08390 [Limosilactobacillus fermentum]
MALTALAESVLDATAELILLFELFDESTVAELATSDLTVAAEDTAELIALVAEVEEATLVLLFKSVASEATEITLDSDATLVALVVEIVELVTALLAVDDARVTLDALIAVLAEATTVVEAEVATSSAWAVWPETIVVPIATAAVAIAMVHHFLPFLYILKCLLTSIG